MNIIQVIKYSFSVLKEGHQLANVEGWKNIQLVTNILYLVVTIASQFLPQLGVIDSEQMTTTINLISSAIAAIVNCYLTAATTKKIGFKNKEKEEEVIEEEVIEEEEVIYPEIQLQGKPEVKSKKKVSEYDPGWNNKG
jgi:hypothetical protein